MSPTVRDPVAAPSSTPLPSLHGLIGASPAMQAVFRRIERVAPTGRPVLIMGETGTGKERVARALHALSPRRHAPFAPVHCGLVTAELAQSELCGHARGAFTDATHARPGIVRTADGGTVFLDHVDTLPGLAQWLLASLLDWGEVYPLGAARAVRVDVRVIAATNRDLVAAVEGGAFVESLFYRLACLRIALPPLRDRLEDLPLLVEHVRRQVEKRRGTRVDGVAPEALRWLAAQPWPGNVRELIGLLRRAWILTRRGVLEVEHLVAAMDPDDAPAADAPGAAPSAASRPPVAAGPRPPSPRRRRSLALKLAAGPEGVRSGQLAAAAGVSDEAARQTLVALAHDGRLCREGGGCATRYVLSPAASTAATAGGAGAEGREA